MDQAWDGKVRAALEREDHAALAALFDEALALEGREQASHSWLEAISGYDADAITG